MNNQQSTFGYTLVELVIVIVLIGIFSGFFINIFNPSIKQYFMLKTQHSIIMQANSLILQLQTDLNKISFPDIVLNDSDSCQFTIRKKPLLQYEFDAEKKHLIRQSNNSESPLFYKIFDCKVKKFPELRQIQFELIWQEQGVKYVRKKWFRLDP